MKKEELQSLVEEQAQEIRKLKETINDLNDKLFDFENIKKLNIKLQTELYMSQESEKMNNATIIHLTDQLRIYETTFNVLSGGKE